jgi:hypothetical protein
MVSRRVQCKEVQGKSMRTWQADIATGAEGKAYVSMVGRKDRYKECKGRVSTRPHGLEECGRWDV